MPTTTELANALRFLSIDAVQKANSGHPGMPMGMADIAEVLWRQFLKHNPNNPQWPNRDRFILSNGHGSMLLYSLLHLTGYDLSIDDLKLFRQLNSKTPGHPEHDLKIGVETTTGPLGQGLANAVGMALAEKILAAQFNRPGHDIIDHHTYVFLGDGCLMEGISHEACSLAGTHKLGKLIAFWDNNTISIDGHVKGWFTDNTAARFEAYGWHVQNNINGHDSQEIQRAIQEARFVADRPSLICCRTIIAYGAPHLANSNKAHGAPLGADEVAATRKNLDWPHPAFVIPKEIYAEWDMRHRGKQLEHRWQEQFKAYSKEYPELAKELERRLTNKLPMDWKNKKAEHLQAIIAKTEDIATRKASNNCIQAYAPTFPEFLGGSADLTESNLTAWVGSRSISAENCAGNYLHYGVREFAMFAINNGTALHGGFIPFCGTFLIFSQYGINAIRLSALMKQKVIYVFTHDSIGLGEDGPTHQPVEHLMSLRAIPNLSVWRPCDMLETAAAWQFAIEHEGPTCLVLSRQKTKQQVHSEHSLANVHKGGYILSNCEGIPQGILIATGSELELAVNAAKSLTQEGFKVRVVSMPAVDVFMKQSEAYRESVLPKAVKARVAIEAASADYWYKFVGLDGKVIGMHEFGKSAPYEQLYDAFGFTIENIIQTTKDLLVKRCT